MKIPAGLEACTWEQAQQSGSDIPGHTLDTRLCACPEGGILVLDFQWLDDGTRNEVTWLRPAISPAAVQLLRESQDNIGGTWRDRRDALLSRIDTAPAVKLQQAR